MFETVAGISARQMLAQIVKEHKENMKLLFWNPDLFPLGWFPLKMDYILVPP